MDIPTITMPRDRAIEAYREYRDAVHRNPDASREDRAAMIGYRALARGQSVIDLAAAIKVAGLNEQHRPKLAAACATWEWVYFAANWQGQFAFGHDRRWAAIHADQRRGRLPALTFSRGLLPGVSNARAARAVVPTIPLRLRPAGDLSAYTIVWEAAWEDVPVDPLLCRRLAGNLYAVLAVWDLTPLERAVLGSRVPPG